MNTAALPLLVVTAFALGVISVELETPHASPSTVRVGMWTLWHDREVTLTPASATMLQTCEQCAKHAMRQALILRANERSGLTLVAGNRSRPLKTVLLSGGVTLSAHSESAAVRDPVEITGRNGTLILAVTMPVERYVEQVVASESGATDSLESLKALAIVVRSYTLHEDHGHPDYDVCDSTHCQLLHWHTNQRSRAAHAAALATAGETLWFHGRRAQAYFSKDCGGRTASAVEVWPRMPSLPYLDSRNDPYCKQENSGWATELTQAELTAALARHALAAPGWKHLAVDRRGTSGRVVTLQVDGDKITAEDFRIAVGESLGWNRIPSTWFELSQQGDRFFFHGRGTGHGVGLCQKGASVMAGQGRSAHEILGQYFPGAEAADEVTGKSWRSFSRAGFTLETLNSSDAAFLPEIERARAETSERSGLNASGPFVVRAFGSTSAFRDATLAPGWTAAFSEGDWIATQPLAKLAAHRLLVPTLRHEFLHALVEHEAGARAPLWLREGLVELWSGDDEASTRSRTALMTVDAVNAALSHPAGETQSALAHRDAAIYAARLLDHYGRGQVLDWLRSGVPADAVVRIGQR